MSVKKIEIVYLNRKNFTEVDIYFESKLYFGAGEGIRTLDFNLGKVAKYKLV